MRRVSLEVEVDGVEVVIDGEAVELGSEEGSDKVEGVGEVEGEIAELGVVEMGGEMDGPEGVGDVAGEMKAKSWETSGNKSSRSTYLKSEHNGSRDPAGKSEFILSVVEGENRKTGCLNDDPKSNGVCNIRSCGLTNKYVSSWPGPGLLEKH
jgi:hypothetical protein